MGLTQRSKYASSLSQRVAEEAAAASEVPGWCVAPPPLARTAVLPSESHARYQRKSPPATHLVRPSGGKSGAGRAIKFLQGYFCVGLAYTLPSFICGTSYAW
ncbi:hypothetical protein Pmani_032782 [Petrolisthes manimaculis]|uniref:Uncharacterized protein n=1 Tax=Petrolisthes manimaculis TaxID=1843537 RepID=A0AAE1NT52_9EUCA|nr:hypothetical protein Pmani_032782 [Petrolisthes manimaculis]